jgi:hypothetical protein
MQLDIFTQVQARPPRSRRKVTVAVADLWRVWCDNSLTRAEVARELGVTYTQLTRLADRHKLPKRECATRYEIGGAPDDWGEPEPDESLDLSPWVQGRIRELGIAGEWTRR